MKLRNLLIPLVSIFFFMFAVDKVFAKEQMVLFHGTGCPHCAVVFEYMEENKIPDKFNVEVLEVYSNRENAQLFNEILSKNSVPVMDRGVPALVVGRETIIGDVPIIDYFEARLAEMPEPVPMPVADPVMEEPMVIAEEPVVEESSPDLTIFPVIAASIVDAINPCAFAVLIILMSTVLATGDGKRALKSGLAFAASIFISYLLMGLGIYKAIELGGAVNTLYKVVGWLAIIIGLLNLKDWLWYGKGFLMEVPMAWRPKMKGLIQSVTSPLGAFGVGFLVSLFLLPCTSGPYIVILGMLSSKVLWSKAILYLVLYNLVFVSPMILITFAVYKGFDPKKAEKMRQKRLKLLHLIAGVIMIAVGVVVLLGWI